MLDRELQHSTSHSPTPLLGEDGEEEEEEERENLCFVPGINRKEIHGRFFIKEIHAKAKWDLMEFLFSPPKATEIKGTDCAL